MARGSPLDSLVRALSGLGVGVESVGRPAADSVLVRPGPAAPAVIVRIRTIASADPLRVAAILRERTPGHPAGQPTVLVADRVPDASRALLRAAGWGWMDRRGHLRLQGPGLLLDTAVPPERPGPVRLSPGIRGVGGLTWAAALLSEGPRLILRDVARRTGLAPSTLAAAARALRDAGLGTPSAELFWALSGVWRPEWVILADPEATAAAPAGALVSGAAAVRMMGGEVAGDGSAGGPTRYYVTDRGAVDALVDCFGEVRQGRRSAVGGTAEGAMPPTTVAVAVAPTPLVFSPVPGWEGRGVVGPLFAALDLVTEPGGPGLLEGWEPPAPGRAWWRDR